MPPVPRPASGTRAPRRGARAGPSRRRPGPRRSGDAGHTRPATAGERHPFDRPVEQRRRRLGAPQDVTVPQPLACGDHPRPHLGRSLTGGAANSSARGRGIAMTRSNDRATPVRPSRGRPRSAVDCRAQSAAPFPTPSTRAEVHRRDESESRREERMPADTRNRHDAVLERLPQRLEHRPRELRQLVEQEDAAVREARLAGARRRRRRRRSPPPRRRDAARETAARG